MIVAIDAGDAIIVASDRREVFKANGKIVRIENDSTNKFVEWNGGYITGCGYVALLNELKTRMAKENIERTDDILKIMQDIELSCDFPDEMVQETHWLFTYITEIDQCPEFRIAMIDPHQTADFRVLNNRNCTIWLNSDKVESLINQVNQQIMSFSDFDNIQNAVGYYIEMLTQLFTIGASESQSVSTSFDVVFGVDGGYQLLSGCNDLG